jgi:short-subunit dehydrogenase
MARAFANRGVRLALSAFPGLELPELRKEVEGRCAAVFSSAYDLRDPAQRSQLLDEVTNAFGRIDILINNAGVEFTAAYHELPEERLKEILSVNLEAPMFLSRQVLPGMLSRKCGHIVNISSLAGKSGPAYQEPYAATKAALVAFTASLRATYRGTGVSASVVIPGFVEAGIYASLKQRTGCSAPPLLGATTPQRVASAVLRSIEKNLPEVIVNPLPVRPLLALNAMFPSLGEWVINQMGGNAFFRRVVEAQKQTAPPAVNRDQPDRGNGLA